MKLKPIRRLNKVDSLPNISTFRPKLKKNFSTNNISATTNASGINSYNNSSTLNSQNRSHNSKKITLHKIKLNNNSNAQDSIKKSWIMPPALCSRKGILDTFQIADKILKERIQNHDKDFEMRKRLLKSIALKESKRMSHKNYLIDALKQKRTEIANKEYEINKALEEFEIKLDSDNKKFMGFIEEIREKQRKDEDKIMEIKHLQYIAGVKLEEEERKKKMLEQNIYRKIRELYIMKDYGSFVHKILETDFPYDILLETKNENNPEKAAEIFIELFNKMKNYDETQKEIEKIDIFFKKCILMEEKIIKGFSEKDILEKEIVQIKKNNINELKQLKISKADYESDHKYLLNEIKKLKYEMQTYKLNVDNDDFFSYLSYILDLGLEIDSSLDKPQNYDKKNLTEFISYSKKITSELKKTEDKVNEYISEIEQILESGNKKDKELMMKLILNKKNINKKEKQILFQQKEEELKMKQKLKILERNKKIIMKGKKVIYDYPINNHQNNKFLKIRKASNIKDNDDNKIEFEYTFSDEDNQN